jgi:hypothetical protein
MARKDKSEIPVTSSVTSPEAVNARNKLGEGPCALDKRFLCQREPRRAVMPRVAVLLEDG